MTDTREKLLEAKYFLQRMTENQSEREYFKYNLSAFLAATRSVTLIMQKEFDKVSSFKEWYADKQIKMGNDPEMNILNNKRVTTIHQKPVCPSAHINVLVHETVYISDSMSVVITHANGTVERLDSKPEPLPKPAKNEGKIEWRWYFDELPDKDVLTFCKEQLVKLEAIVGECESAFT